MGLKYMASFFLPLGFAYAVSSAFIAYPQVLHIFSSFRSQLKSILFEDSSLTTLDSSHYSLIT